MHFWHLNNFCQQRQRKNNGGGGHLEIEACEIYTSAIYKKFEDEFFKSMSLVVSRCMSETGCEVKCARPKYFQAYGNVVQTFCWFHVIESSDTVQILARERSSGKTTEEEYDVAPTPSTTFTPVSTFGQPSRSRVHEECD